MSGNPSVSNLERISHLYCHPDLGPVSTSSRMSPGAVSWTHPSATRSGLPASVPDQARVVELLDPWLNDRLDFLFPHVAGDVESPRPATEERADRVTGLQLLPVDLDALEDAVDQVAGARVTRTTIEFDCLHGGQ